MKSLISVHNASFGYNNQPILSDVSLEIEKGEFAGLVGPNGAGKTTLLRGLLGLIAPLSGRVTQASVIRKRIGYVPQRDQLDTIFPLTAGDVVMMGASAHVPWYAVADKTAKETVARSLTKVGMGAFASHPFDTLSGGQRQRILIARALAARPSILVLDEPTAGIDLIAEEQILSFLRSINRDEQLTILMVSHHIESLKKAINRVIVVDDAKVRVGNAP